MVQFNILGKYQNKSTLETLTHRVTDPSAKTDNKQMTHAKMQQLNYLASCSSSVTEWMSVSLNLWCYFPLSHPCLECCDLGENYSF